MKKLCLIIGTTIFISSPTVQAQDDNNDVNICDLVPEAAEVMMNGRQNGLTLPKAMAVVQDIDSDSVLRNLYELILLDAYETPGYSTPEMKRTATTEFINKWTLACLRFQRGEK